MKCKHEHSAVILGKKKALLDCRWLNEKRRVGKKEKEG